RRDRAARAQDDRPHRRGQGRAGAGRSPAGLNAPRARRHTGQMRPSAGAEPLRPAAPRVVIADDDAVFRSEVRAALQDAGIVVIAEADNGRDAIDLAVHFRPDVVLMDVVMVGMDGISATRAIADRAPEVSVVLLTSSQDAELGMIGLRAGADG